MANNMYRKAILLMAASTFTLLLSTPRLLAWSVTTHELISVKAATSILNVELVQSLGLSDISVKITGTDFEEKEKTQNIITWIENGAKFEDAGNLFSGRFFNHFHNPLHQAPWAQAGLDDVLVPFPLLIPIPIDGESSLRWAQDDQNNPTWSWQATRNYYYEAMTSLQDKDRQANFARMFSGIGHMVHLVQDMAQPAHVRNDAHPIDGAGISGLETWAVDNNDIVGDILDTPPVFPALSLDTSIGGLDPITQFWDTDQYDGTAATLPLTSGTTVGLAEYTNANFFSDDTIDSFFSRHQFPFPSNNPADYNICDDAAPPNSSGTLRKYWSNSEDCNVQPLDHFVAISVIDSGKTERTYRVLDSKVHEDYAKALIPRAVGYSAGLIDYFFRGQLAISPAQNGITIRNDSEETLGLDPVTGDVTGTFSVFYDDPSDTRQPLASLNLISPLAPGDNISISFSNPSDVRRYIVVFRGPLGTEQDAVIGKVISQQIFYVSRRNGVDKIFRIGLDGESPILVYDNLNPDVELGTVAPSSDGRILAFTSRPRVNPPLNPTIFLLDLEDATATASVLTQGGFPTWSPDSTRIAFHRQIAVLPDNPEIAIFIRDITFGTETKITSFNTHLHPSWSPNGNRLAVSRFAVPTDTNTPPETCLNDFVILLLDTAGNNIKPVSCSTENGFIQDKTPSWKPDQQEIAFVRSFQIGGRPFFELYKTFVLTGSVTKLTESTGMDFNELVPSWSLDETVIAIGSTRDGDSDIWLVDPNGGGYIQNLTGSNIERDANPAFGWSP